MLIGVLVILLAVVFSGCSSINSIIGQRPGGQSCAPGCRCVCEGDISDAGELDTDSACEITSIKINDLTNVILSTGDAMQIKVTTNNQIACNNKVALIYFDLSNQGNYWNNGPYANGIWVNLEQSGKILNGEALGARSITAGANGLHPYLAANYKVKVRFPDQNPQGGQVILKINPPSAIPSGGFN